MVRLVVKGKHSTSNAKFMSLDDAYLYLRSFKEEVYNAESCDTFLYTLDTFPPDQTLPALVAMLDTVGI